MINFSKSSLRVLEFMALRSDIQEAAIDYKRLCEKFSIIYVLQNVFTVFILATSQYLV